MRAKQKAVVQLREKMSGGILLKRCSDKFRKIQNETPVSESLFFIMNLQIYNVQFYQKKALAQAVSCEYLQNLLEQVYRTQTC